MWERVIEGVIITVAAAAISAVAAAIFSRRFRRYVADYFTPYIDVTDKWTVRHKGKPFDGDGP